jgi:hypothetical protein
MTANGHCSLSRTFGATCAELGTRHMLAEPYTHGPLREVRC